MVTASGTLPAYLVFGSTGGVGSELAGALRQRSPRVLLAGRELSRLSDLGHRLDAPTMSVDASDFGRVQQCFDRAIELFGRIDGVANCVGTLLLKPAHLTSDAEWQETIAANLTSSFGILRAAAKAMKTAGGSIVLVSSAAARVGIPNHEAIAAAKAGVIGLAMSAAATYASSGIRVNAVAPGLIRSRLTEKLLNNPHSSRASLAMHALGRIGEPRDVASLIAWLLDPSQSWITGQVFGVDGGLASVRPKVKV